MTSGVPASRVAPHPPAAFGIERPPDVHADPPSKWKSHVPPSNPRVRLVPATPTLLSALTDDPVEFERLIGSPIPSGWPEFPESVPHAFEFLKRAGPDDARWSMHFFIDDAASALVGSGGYVGPPARRTVEIGYEIAPGHRRQGFARAAARALISQARATEEVDTVTAHTLRGPNPSSRLLESLDFTFAGTLHDPAEGEIWAWRLEGEPRG